MTLLALPNRHQITIHKAQSQHSFSLHPMNTAQWPQENNTMVMRPLEEIVVMRKAAASSVVERKVRPHQKQEAVNCPRCNSTNTKFCYYNNYSLSQPRYFCKTCRRYWTEGGTLRNIPVGGGTRSKNKSIRSSSSNSSSTDSITSNNNINNNNNNNININITSSSSSSLPQLQNPNKIHDDDLSLGFTTLPDFKTINELIQVPNFEENNSNDKKVLQTDLSATSMGLMSSFMPNNMVVYSSGFSVLPELIRPNNSDLNFDGLGNNYENLQGVQEAINGKVLFPFEDLKQGDSTTVNANDPHQKQGDSTTGFWNGVMGGEVSW